MADHAVEVALFLVGRRQVVVSVGELGVDLEGFLIRFDRALHIAGLEVEVSLVHPGPGVLGVATQRLGKGGSRRLLIPGHRRLDALLHPGLGPEERMVEPRLVAPGVQILHALEEVGRGHLERPFEVGDHPPVILAVDGTPHIHEGLDRPASRIPLGNRPGVGGLELALCQQRCDLVHRSPLAPRCAPRPRSTRYRHGSAPAPRARGSKAGARATAGASRAAL